MIHGGGNHSGPDCRVYDLARVQPPPPSFGYFIVNNPKEEENQERKR
jgi:hypothetical protein